jgi:AraC family transcriptional regulator of adaptative response/methylated-DNA-[protein]-cysteine methyltransferase
VLHIPVGTVVSYEDIALYIGFPRAVRAVGNAVGKNPVSFVIPCHRVVRKTADSVTTAAARRVGNDRLKPA